MSITMTDLFAGGGGSSTGALSNRYLVKVAGTAITPPSARDLIAASIDSIGAAA